MRLDTPISQLNRVGKTIASRLARLRVKIAGDLLYYFPFRYEDFRRIVPIKDLEGGQAVTVSGKLELIANRRSFRARKIITEAMVSDDTGSLRVIWFNQPFIIKNLHPGDNIMLSGTVKGDMLGAQLVSPIYEKIRPGVESINTARLVPIYPLTEGITQKQIRFLIKEVLPLAKEVKEWLPEDILDKNELISLSEALRGIHFPENEAHLKVSTERLKFDELFLLQLKAELTRLQRTENSAIALSFKEKEIKEFVGKLPFVLTPAQKISAWDILKDISTTIPMNRLLSGDVGSGKTVVAAIAMYNATLNGCQAAMMAPTEILAKQHFDTICKILGDKMSIGLLTSSSAGCHSERASEGDEESLSQQRTGGDLSLAFGMTIKSKSKQKKELVSKIKSGDVQIVVGTHALLTESVEFLKLGLVIVDEQHRFGVEQRKLIKEKSLNVDPSASPLNKGGTTMAAHFLSMTATPIPRSFALMLYGDLDVSTINQMPPGRKSIITRLVNQLNRQKAYDFIRAQIKQGRQAFVICPLIEERGEVITEKKSVMNEYEKLSKKIFPDLKISYLHGKLKSSEKERIMAEFKNGKIDVLVSTSVVEVGVDIPNASVMMIEGAERFGLAQLHQFRGRVGRSSYQSYCLLFMDSDSYRAQERLQYFEKTLDGFKLAEKDLEIRGPGEVYGTEQSGMMQLRLAKLTDIEAVKKARVTAKLVVSDLKKYPAIETRIKEWEKRVHLE